MSAKDRLYDTQVEEEQDFVFDERVVRVFPDMINRSVPGYALIVPIIGMLARRYAQDNSTLYDLGCSLGAAALAMSQAVRANQVRIVAVDSSTAMISRLGEMLEAAPAPDCVPIDPVCEDLLETRVENASVVVLNFTLQFVSPGARLPLLRRIARGLLPGGILLLSEKIRFETDQEQDLQTTWHHDFKRAQGYSDLEISRKRDALENVLKPDSLHQHQERLLKAGFSQVHPWFQMFNFRSLVAFR